MTNDRMVLIELVEKQADGDLVRATPTPRLRRNRNSRRSQAPPSRQRRPGSTAAPIEE